MHSILRSLAAAATLTVAAAAMPLSAGPDDYAFEPVSRNIRLADDAELAFRLIHKPTGTPVQQAVLLRTRLDMSPDDMAEMTTNHAAQASPEPGVYKFSARITMAGGWALSVAARVPGETEVIRGTVIFKAK